MKFLFFAAILFCLTISAKAQLAPVRTSNPSSGAQSARVAATPLPLRTSDAASKTTASSTIQQAPLRTSDSQSKATDNSAIQKAPLRSSDPSSNAVQQGSSNQKAATAPKTPVFPSEQAAPANNDGKSAELGTKSTTQSKS